MSAREERYLAGRIEQFSEQCPICQALIPVNELPTPRLGSIILSYVEKSKQASRNTIRSYVSIRQMGEKEKEFKLDKQLGFAEGGGRISRWFSCRSGTRRRVEDSSSGY